MLQSQLFTKTRKEAPKDEVSKNAELLIRAGFIHKNMAGVYSYLPLGLRVYKKIENIIREEMNKVGGQEVNLSSLQSKDVWEATDRWSDEVVDNWFKTRLKNGTDVGLGFTHEEPLTLLMRDHVNSYKDLPKLVYQFQNKFRNEARSKSGIMRVREFMMKDLYSFARDEKEHEEIYEKMKEAYRNVYERVGLGDKTYITYAAGGTFSKYSHEFQTLTEVGEDTIYLNESKKIAVNKEVYNDEVLGDLDLKKEDLKEKKAVEVGNIFPLGTKFSGAFGLNFKDKDGQAKPVIMGSYGIGLGRLLGVIAEVYSSENGLGWPLSVSPFSLHLIQLGDNDEVTKEANEIYQALSSEGIDVLFDDRSVSAGEKFNDADLIGIPYRVIVSEKTLSSGELEIKHGDNVSMMSLQDFLSGGFKKILDNEKN